MGRLLVSAARHRPKGIMKLPSVWCGHDKLFDAEQYYHDHFERLNLWHQPWQGYVRMMLPGYEMTLWHWKRLVVGRPMRGDAVSYQQMARYLGDTVEVAQNYVLAQIGCYVDAENHRREGPWHELLGSLGIVLEIAGAFATMAGLPGVGMVLGQGGRRLLITASGHSNVEIDLHASWMGPLHIPDVLRGIWNEDVGQFDVPTGSSESGVAGESSGLLPLVLIGVGAWAISSTG